MDKIQQLQDMIDEIGISSFSVGRVSRPSI